MAQDDDSICYSTELGMEPMVSSSSITAQSGGRTWGIMCAKLHVSHDKQRHWLVGTVGRIRNEEIADFSRERNAPDWRSGSIFALHEGSPSW